MDDEKHMTRVLVFPCGTEIGLEIHRALCHSTHMEVFGLNSVPSNHARYVYSRYQDDFPDIHAPECLEEINLYARQNRIDYLYPAHDEVSLQMRQWESVLQCEVIGSPLETCRICRSKSQTYARFSGLIPVPKLHDEQNRQVYPIFVKPDRGQGSKGARKVLSEETWKAALADEPDLLSMEYLPGREYTIDCFTDRRGALRFAGGRERVRTSNGISVNTRAVKSRLFEEYARCINETLVFRGAWFFQMKENAHGHPVLLEIAPRVSGGMGLYRNLGANLPLLSVYDRMGIEVEVIPQWRELEMDRALAARFSDPPLYNHVYIDFDDTLVHDGRVNPLAVAFLFQCRNRNKAIHLLTKHAGDIDVTLKKYALSELFSSVTKITEGTKAEYIRQKDAIFIDDSFSERRRVHKKLGIPVFDLDAIECLLDWRA